MRDLLGMLGCILGYPACNLNRSMIVKMNTHIPEIQKYIRLMIWSLPVTIPSRIVFKDTWSDSHSRGIQVE